MKKIIIFLIFLSNIVNVYSQLDPDKKATDAFKRELIESMEADKNDNYKKGDSYFMTKDYDNAINYLTLALSELPNNKYIKERIFRAIRSRAYYYSKISESRKAIMDYTKYLDYIRDRDGNTNEAICGEIYNNRGISFAKLEKYKEAIDDFTEAISRNGYYVGAAYYSRAICYKNMNYKSMACKDFYSAYNNNYLESKWYIDNYCK